ncbi:putative Ig domain-containing protein [Spirosoma validum]|uniref:Dystroglycan-type cadherin-like domain-containing protein n=1 Tax=Spirosoma validum TaxID=2771355 RepID=A0A927GD45_9BACT|nr:putative Ig domain-containing protein [Spirosoma validum]MBD2753293.1 hypothetical protein [Spirosoma validum]
MQLQLPTSAFTAFIRCMWLLIGLTVAANVTAAPVITSAASFTNPCGLLPPVLTPSAATAVVGSGPVSVTATGCPGGIIQYFGNGGVNTIAPGTAFSVPTSTTGTVVVPTLCSANGCVSDISEAVITVIPNGDPNQALRPTVSNPIGTQTATVGQSFVFIIPSNTFSDPQNDPLTLTASGLPDGFSFNGVLIFGTATENSTSQITITAQNSKGLTTNTMFSLIVSGGVQVPDLTPIITTTPSTLYGNSDFTVRVDVVELNSAPSSGPITVYVTKQTQYSLVLSSAPQNSVWNLNASSNTNYYVLTTSASVPAGGALTFRLNGSLTPAGSSGTISISTVIIGGSGGETKANNNIDVDRIETFSNPQ